MDKLYYDNFNLEITLNTFDPQSTALTIGIINQICSILNSIFIFNNKNYNLTYSNRPNFIENKNRIEFDVKVYFTIFDMIFAIVMSFYRRGKYVKQEK
ncbi:MAG: hypothetical protein ACI4PF_06065 [Christensenellales bacterium]